MYFKCSEKLELVIQLTADTLNILYKTLYSFCGYQFCDVIRAILIFE